MLAHHRDVAAAACLFLELVAVELPACLCLHLICREAPKRHMAPASKLAEPVLAEHPGIDALRIVARGIGESMLEAGGIERRA